MIASQLDVVSVDASAKKDTRESMLRAQEAWFWTVTFEKAQSDIMAVTLLRPNRPANRSPVEPMGK